MSPTTTTTRLLYAMATLVCSSMLNPAVHAVDIAAEKTGNLRALATSASAATTEQFDGPAPMLQDEVEQILEDRPALTKLPDAKIELARFFDRDVDFRYDEKTGALIIESKLTLDTLAEAPSVPGEMLDSQLLEDPSFIEQFVKTDFEGSLPDHLAFSAKPTFVQDDASVVIAEGNDIATNVFGADDRKIFHDHRYPLSTVGKVENSGDKYCTGTMVGRRLMLTAAHCVHWTSDNQFGWLKFTPSYYGYDETPPFGVAWATKIIYWEKLDGKKGLSRQEIAFDYVIAVLDRNIGDLTGYAGYKTYSTSWNNLKAWSNIGYPGELTFGERPVISSGGAISYVQSKTGSSSGQTGYVLGHFIDTEGGHSGGPVWGWWAGETYPRIIGDHSAEMPDPGPTFSGANKAGGGPALSALIAWARDKFP
jgi:V8-like Glu-specific endopeptidase